jgi:transposase, IS30 family
MGRREIRRGKALGGEERDLVLSLLEEGEHPELAARTVGCSLRTVQRLRAESLIKSRRIGPSGRQLSFAERERISRGLAAGERPARIARELGRHRATIGRELARNGGAERYRALGAHRRALACLERPKPTKLSRCPRLRDRVEAGLLRRWSPEQISARLRREHPDDEEMRISHETIYRSLFIQSRGELRRQLARNLRSGRSKRRPRGGGTERRGRIRDMVPISERPPQVEDRAVPGHWEGDLLMGKAGRSAIATLVERKTRYVMLARLGGDRSTERVIGALKERIRALPEHLVRSLTWDQGKELSEHARFKLETGVDVYFCDPHSPWQRGSNENTNGLLRQYLPKSTDLAPVGQAELDRIAAELNGRPRQTLGWATPAEKMDELLR